jgi:hypothetical protein
VSAVQTIEALFILSMTVKDAFVKASATGKMDWVKFVESPEFATIGAEVDDLLGKMGGSEITAALGEVQVKKKALLNGQPISQVSSEKLTQYFALLSTEGLLVAQELKNASASPPFLEWLVNTALPALVPILKVVVPLLL